MRYMALALFLLATGCETTARRGGTTTNTSAAPPGSSSGPRDPSALERELRRTCEDLIGAFQHGDVKFIWDRLVDEEKTDAQGKPVLTFEQFQSEYEGSRERAAAEAKGMKIKSVASEGRATAVLGAVLVELGTGEQRVMNFVREGGVWKYRSWKK